MVHKHSKIFTLVLVLIMIFILQSVKVAAVENSLLFEGEDFTVELTFTNKANISENATLKVTEFYEGSQEFQNYYSQTEKFISKNTEDQISYIRFFDICILDGDKEIEPDDTVEVSIVYKDAIEKESNEEMSVIHFIENGDAELIEIQEDVLSEEEVSQITFEQNSFSVIGMIVFNGIDSDIKDVQGESMKKTVSVNVEKVWSDGEEAHENDSVKVSLYEMNDEEWTEHEEVILNAENEWKGSFENLDRSREYGIRETKVISGDENKKATYRSEITNTSEKAWCPKKENELSDGENILLVSKNSKYNLLRKSSSTTNMVLKTRTITTKNDDLYGVCCTDNIISYEIWESVWNEEKGAWLFYHLHSNVYLSLVYNSQQGTYEWTTTKEIGEGSYLNYKEGIISATVNGVTKYLGCPTTSGPYEGLDEGDSKITAFEVFIYQIYKPGKYVITNIRNDSLEEQKIQADVITDKKIDYLGDKNDNPETDVDNGKVSEKVLKDLYRLKLGLEMRTDMTGLDLLMVIDVSSSMNKNQDCIDSSGKRILRSEALRQALNQFLPAILPENTKNRVSIVAFENQSIILQDWTQNSAEILEKINREVNGTLPLYNGEGTNYEAALTRAHEAWTRCGYSGNAKAMIFLSDGDPTVYIHGNDSLEPGNVTTDLGETILSDGGIEGEYTDNFRSVWTSSEDEKVQKATNEAIESFQKHNPEIMVGSIAFKTNITEYLQDLATNPEFVVQIQKGTPNDLIEAMELITNFVPMEIKVTDELSEYVSLYEEEPDIKVTVMRNQDENVLFTSEEGLSNEGKLVLNQQNPLEIDGKLVKLHFQRNYIVENESTYYLSFNIRPSQKAYDEYSDRDGRYPDIGDEQTDVSGNDTSSYKEGFHSNGERTKASYVLNGVVIEKNYRKPVIQVKDGRLRVQKTDLDGNRITSGTKFTLYREAEEKDKNKVKINGLSGSFIKAAEGMTDENGEIVFEHLRLAVFDKGYPYYLVETTAPEGYVENKEPVKIMIYENETGIDENAWVSVAQDGTVVVKNAEIVEPLELPVMGGGGTKIFYLLGIILITGGLFMLRNKKLSKVFMLVLTFIMGFQMSGVQAMAIGRTDTGKISVGSVEEGVSIDAYRLMDIQYDFDVDQPKNPMYMWTEEMAEWVEENFASYIDMENQNAVKEAFSDVSEADAALFYDMLAVAIKAGEVNPEMKNVVATGETVEITDLTMGNYFLLVEGGAKVYRPLSANVVPEWADGTWKMSTPSVQAKASTPSITKTVTNGLVKDNADIGDTVSFELNAVVPTYPENATAKKFVISDKLSEGLSLVEDSIKVYGLNTGKEEELLDAGYTTGAERPVDVENKQVSFSLDFDYSVISKYESLKVTYDTLLNANAVVGENGNKNHVFLDYNNNPYARTSWNTDSDENTVYTYGMKISKIDEDSGNGLSGAEFTLEKDGQEILFAGGNGIYHVADATETGNKTIAVDENGLLTLNGLDAGTYSLTEVKAPGGYVKLQNPIEIVVSDEDMDGKVEDNNQELENGYMPVTVRNDKGFTLPVTGGIGTTLFNVIGIALMGSGIILIGVFSRKRRNEK